MNDKTVNEERSIGQKIAGALENMMELRVVTVVGDATVSGTFPDIKMAFDGAQAKTIATSIDLVQGDTHNLISPAYSGNTGDPLRTFHAEQVAASKEIVERNVQLCVDLGREIVSLVKDLGEGDTEAPDVEEPVVGGREGAV